MFVFGFEIDPTTSCLKPSIAEILNINTKCFHPVNNKLEIKR